MSSTKGPVVLTTVCYLLSGLLGNKDYNVTYSTSICGLNGSFVDIPCTYTYPRDLEIIEAFWHIKNETEKRGERKDTDDLSLDSRYKARVEYLGDTGNNCSLRIKDLRDSDTEEQYRFMFLTNDLEEESSGFEVSESVKEGYQVTDDSVRKYSRSEVSLTLTGLHVKVSPESVKEGHTVTLTCSTTCSLSNNPTYIWYKNSQPLNNSPPMSNETLSIASFSKEDASYYSCAVRGHEAHPSPSVCVSFLSVTYTPQSICALKGSSVELHSTYPCRRVEEAIWFITGHKDLREDEHYQGRLNYTEKSNNSHTLSIRNLTTRDSNKYIFRFITNKEIEEYSGENVDLIVTELQVFVNPATVKEGDNVTLTCNTTCSLSNNLTYIWYKNSQPVNDLHTTDNALAIDSVRTEDAGKYSCSFKGHDIHKSPEMSLNVRYSPKNTSASENSTGVRISLSDPVLLRGIMFSVLGGISAVALLLVVVVCWRREEAQSTKTSRSTHSNTQRVSEDHKDDDEDDKEDIQYANVQFKPNKKQEVPSPEETVQYASVQFRNSNPEPNVPEPPPSDASLEETHCADTSKEETQIATVNVQGLSAVFTQLMDKSATYSKVNMKSKSDAPIEAPTD